MSRHPSRPLSSPRMANTARTALRGLATTRIGRIPLFAVLACVLAVAIPASSAYASSPGPPVAHVAKRKCGKQRHHRRHRRRCHRTPTSPTASFPTVADAQSQMYQDMLLNLNEWIAGKPYTGVWYAQIQDGSSINIPGRVGKTENTCVWHSTSRELECEIYFWHDGAEDCLPAHNGGMVWLIQDFHYLTRRSQIYPTSHSLETTAQYVRFGCVE